ncbi:MAG: ORF6N domain-containing protein, partial [Chitinophagales bacterium]
SGAALPFRSNPAPSLPFLPQSSTKASSFMPLDSIASALVLSDDLAPREVSDRIHFIRGQHVILDSDLAWMYGVETKALNKAVSRNTNRFPEHFRFQLFPNEWSNLRFQSGTSSSTHGGRRFLPFAFTEQGVAMLSSVLNSERAIQMNIQIIRIFTKMKEMALTHKDMLLKIEKLETQTGKNSSDIQSIFKALKQLLQEPKIEEKRTKIGFKKD